MHHALSEPQSIVLTTFLGFVRFRYGRRPSRAEACPDGAAERHRGPVPKPSSCWATSFVPARVRFGSRAGVCSAFELRTRGFVCGRFGVAWMSGSGRSGSFRAASRPKLTRHTLQGDAFSRQERRVSVARLTQKRAIPRRPSSPGEAMSAPRRWQGGTNGDH